MAIRGHLCTTNVARPSERFRQPSLTTDSLDFFMSISQAGVARLMLISLFTPTCTVLETYL